MGHRWNINFFKKGSRSFRNHVCPSATLFELIFKKMKKKGFNIKFVNDKWLILLNVKHANAKNSIDNNTFTKYEQELNNKSKIWSTDFTWDKII